jgi:50S ribosomal protein L16 3-hydroxylase
MRLHWQRKPLLIRAAFPAFVSPVVPQDLFALAAREGIESRLISGTGRRWKLEHGPFDPDRLPLAARRNWTLLVQGMDLHDDAVHELLSRFRFIADARLDDLMISYAVDGGGVGPHLDSYDVFLIQAHGRRRWRISPPGDDALVPGMPLKILANFTPTEEWVLEPGDMLYLPPNWAHEGVAIGECMTFSVGFRAPSRHELLSAWLADCADETPTGPDPRYGDAGAKPTTRPGQIPATMHDTLSGWLRGWKPSNARIDDFIGRFLTEPKRDVWFEPPERAPSPRAFASAAIRRGVRADRRTRMSYRRGLFFINGESFVATDEARTLARNLADDRELPPEVLGSDEARALLEGPLADWHAAGWIHLGRRATRASR